MCHNEARYVGDEAWAELLATTQTTLKLSIRVNGCRRTIIVPRPRYNSARPPVYRVTITTRCGTVLILPRQRLKCIIASSVVELRHHG
jgi:hypothetical protein